MPAPDRQSSSVSEETRTSSSSTSYNNTKWVLKQRPKGLFNPDTDVEQITEEIPIANCGDDEIIIETSCLSIDAFLRTMLDADAYHGSVDIGCTMPAIGYGKVIFAGSKTKSKVGSYVTGMVGAQTHATVKSSEMFGMMKLPFMERRDSLGLIGASTGLTAYAGIFYVCKPPKKTDTVVITAAAGAVGSIASQLAKSTGARVIGVAGGKIKGSYLVDELGIDAAIDYKCTSKTIDQQLDEYCPDGIDFIYDNVGGEILNTLLGKINPNGRVVICGAISQYGKARGTATGPSNYIKLAEKGATMKGFNFMIYIWKLPFMLIGMLYLYARGKVKMTEHVETGIDSYPIALYKLFTGGNTGKTLVQVKSETSSQSESISKKID